MDLVRSQHRNLAIIFLLLLGVPLLFWPTSLSMITIWERSETFTHGFLIFPISTWLIWQRRDELALMMPQPNYRILPLLMGAGLGWFLAYSVDVQVVQQFALIAIIQLSIWILLGTAIIKAILFPLLYLYFAVPFGENLIPPLMEFTATFTVNMVELTGIPVYREGLFFTLPTGDWSVVQACSGIRYLIASFALGSLYAYLTYSSYRKRTLFIIASLIVPILANGMRAFLIVMMGHFSGMELAVGADHLLYGWFFFGIVIFILFWIGSFWRDPLPELPKPETATFSADATRSPLLKPSLYLLGTLTFWIGLGYYLTASPTDEFSSEQHQLISPEIDSWIKSNTESHWEPSVSGESTKLTQHYQQNQQQAILYIGYYAQQSQGREAAGSMNRMASLQPDPDSDMWRQLHNRMQSHQQKSYIETRIKRGNQQLLVWHWYRIGDYRATNRYQAKLLEVANKLIYRRHDASIIAVAVPIEESADSARQQLQDVIEPFESAAHRQLDSLNSTR